MAIITPRPEIAKRWHGALSARLRRAPLERFLVSHGLPGAASGAAQDTDDIARAAIYVVTACLDDSEQLGLSSSQRWGIALATCVLCEAIASGIGEDSCWRIAALVSIARLLAPQSDLTDSARFAATVVRAYERQAFTIISVGDIERLQILLHGSPLGAPAWGATASEAVAGCLRLSECSLIESEIDEIAQPTEREDEQNERPRSWAPSKAATLRLVHSKS